MSKDIIKRNEFNLEHVVRQTTRFGQLLPFLCQEVLPGDTFDISITSLVRFMPLLAPAMSDIYGKMDLFFVPNRLLWKNWESFITGGEDGKDVSEMPYFDFSKSDNGVEAKSLFDNLGIGLGFKGKISALPIRGINLIWNEWYRNQNLQEKRVVSLEDGLDETTDSSIPFRNFEKDYFTCSFPYAQKGEPVIVPLGDIAPVKTGDDRYNNSDIQLKWNSSGTGTQNNIIGIYGNNGLESGTGIGGDGSAGALYGKLYPTNLYADLSQAQAATVDAIRQAFQVQKFQFMNLKGGSRYVEYIYNFYGVRSSDARVQRPELIASNTFNVMIQEVVQSSQSENQNTPTGTLYGKALASGNSGNIVKSFEEHGYLIGLYSIQPKTEYMQMVERSYTRFSRFDYYNPVFAFLGYQAIKNKEIYSKSDNPDEIFGFQGRYDEYRHRQSYNCGDLRSSLKFWTTGRDFDSQPLLNSSFINATNSSDRIFSNTVDDYLVVEFYNDITAFRPLPKDSDPGLIDHVYN